MTPRSPFLAAIVAAGLTPPAVAADHVDGPTAAADPTADLADLFAWMSDDTTKVNLVLTLATLEVPEATFSDAVVYAFHVNSSAAYGEAQTETLVRCAFYDVDRIECWAGDDAYVDGDPTDPAGLADGDDRLRVFAGPRSDPFFWNRVGFFETVAAVKAAAPTLTFDQGCPVLDGPTSTALVTQLQSDASGGPGEDFYAGETALALVVQVDTDVLTAGGPLLGVWASTHTLD